jgi:hypothetical protein
MRAGKVHKLNPALSKFVAIPAAKGESIKGTPISQDRPLHGTARIYLDGEFQSSVSTYAPTWLAQQLLYEMSGLTNGQHTIKIEVVAAASQDVDVFQYRTGNSPP